MNLSVVSPEGGFVFNVQRFSTSDGPGIRTTVFFKGCPLHCPWCHNPESLNPEPELAVIESRCIGCLECVPGGAKDDKPAAGAIVGPRSLWNTTIPDVSCPTGAREVVGRWWSVSEVFGVILRDRLFYDGSGGGVTFSGGEPLAQPLFLEQCLQASADQGIHTAVDTSGAGPRDSLLAIAPLTDVFLFDLKPLAAGAHRKLVGVSFGHVVANLEALARADTCIWIRVPIVRGLADDPARLAEIRRLAHSLPAVRKISLLPYHATGTGKYERLGRRIDRGGFEAPPEERLQKIVRDFEAAGLDVSIGG